VTAAPASRLGALGEIVARRRLDVARDLAGIEPAELRRRLAQAPEPRAIGEALAAPGLHLIAEVKRSSPSAGAIAPAEDDLVARALAYERGGAAAISVLCEPHWFHGSIDDLRKIRAAVSRPVLAKEFVVEARQLELLRAAGADVVLLLAAVHRASALGRLVRRALDLGLEPLAEAHDERELGAALDSGARLIGLNNRDLRSLEVDPDRAPRLRAMVPDDRLVIAESGVREAATIRDWRAAGFDAALVGETLVRTPDPEAATRSFVEAGRQPDDLANRANRVFVKIWPPGRRPRRGRRDRPEPRAGYAAGTVDRGGRRSRVPRPRSERGGWRAPGHRRDHGRPVTRRARRDRRAPRSGCRPAQR
jgi:indole-3-glycerol phosphate synthase